MRAITHRLRNTGRRLARQWKLSVKHALYRKTGDWYHQLEQFPGALLDERGYIVFKTEAEFRECKQLQIHKDVGIPHGIKSIPGYTLAAVRLAETSTSAPGAPSFVEGDRTEIAQSHIERDPAARAACLGTHGFTCSVCGFNFAERYGEIGVGFIHVHHLLPLAGGVRKVDPVTDLCPICPNCHAMAHRKNPPFTIAELRCMLSGKKV